MGIAVTFASSLESVSAWRSTRFPYARFLPLAALVVWAAACEGRAGIATTLTAFAIAASLIAQFRLWDDLIDRARDSAAHPERIVAGAASSTPYVWAVGLLACWNAMALVAVRGASGLLAFLLLCAIAALWYAAHCERGLMHALVLHLKYPAFVLLLAPMFAPRGSPLAAAAIVYCALLGYELLDEPRLRTPSGRLLLFGSLILLAFAPLCIDGASQGPVAALVLVTLVIALGVRLRRARDLAMLRYLPFALASIALTFLTFGGSP